jgi:WhiB family redox-sensing transcriptional regulator
MSPKNNQVLFVPIAERDSREVLASLDEGRDADVDATGLENIELYAAKLVEGVNEVRRRREIAEDIVGDLVLDGMDAVQVDVSGVVLEVDDVETLFMLEVLKRSGGAPVTRHDFNEAGYNKIRDRKVPASNQAFRLRMNKLISLGLVEKEGVKYTLLGDISELLLYESEEMFDKRVHRIIDKNEPLRQNWEDDGNCVDMNPEFFFPERGEDVDPIKAVCRGCPVRAECLVDAVRRNETVGIKGGKSANERRKLKHEIAAASETA